MATTLKSFDFNGAGCVTKYPWKEWQDGRVWKVQHGVDFRTPSNSFQTYLYNRASVQGMSVRATSLLEDGKQFVIFQFAGRAT